MIFHGDDLELFVDPDFDGLRYYELEINDLLEERTEPLEARGRELDLDVAPYRIETIEVEFEG